MPRTITRRTSAKRQARLRQMIGILYQEKLMRGLTPQKLRRVLERLGPTFVKIGQLMSERSDMLPDAYCRELSLLRDQVSPMAFADVQAVLEAELGPARLAAFTYINPVPLGAASIAQVHRATLVEGAREVVIKVQRPGVALLMQEDFLLLLRATKILRLLHAGDGSVGFAHVLEQMHEAMQRELDFLMEAENLLHFEALHRAIPYTACPRPEPWLCTPRVLVMDYIDGLSLTDAAALENAGYNADEIGRRLCQSYVKQIVDDRFFHADPHAGNLLVHGGQIVWMDMGLMGTITLAEQALLKKAVLGVLHQDVGAVKEVLLAMGAPRRSINHSRLYNDLDMILVRYAGTDLAGLDIGGLLREVLAIVQVHGIAIPSNIAILARGMLTLEGIVARCAPTVNFFDVMTSHASAWFLRELDVPKLVLKGAENMLHSAARLGELPVKVSEFLGMLIKGQSKVNIELVGSERPLARLSRMVDKLAVAVIDAAVLMGSALISTTDMQPKLLGIPLLGLAGFCFSLLLGGWLLFQIVKSRLER